MTLRVKGFNHTPLYLEKIWLSLYVSAVPVELVNLQELLLDWSLKKASTATSTFQLHSLSFRMETLSLSNKGVNFFKIEQKL